ncbi:hypothetical protein [Mycolicibacterium hippocampi]|uniref:Lipoprotein n=1 Tax=Mycolicibacterium hippocampi TaxID=659824 RepID=A0A7I9ZP51_9MYCO|nr:hypothetical protein [Mycolicibacterium hippocampi]GFH02804.1 hypothetical protein MHIP_32870 [Mycolicibacterium hippocampi]
MGERSRWRKAALIAAPFLVVGACVAAFIPRADPDPIVEDGTYEVGCFGCEVSAGTWETVGEHRSNGMCLWIKRSSPQVSRSNELDRGQVEPGRRATVELRSGEWFTTMGCRPWERVS